MRLNGLVNLSIEFLKKKNSKEKKHKKMKSQKKKKNEMN
jgi:hypothetical protein